MDLVAASEMKQSNRSNAEQRELESEWQKLLKRHSKPLVTKPMRPSLGNRNPVAGIKATLAMHSDRLVKPNRPTEAKSGSDRQEMKDALKRQMIDDIGIDEYNRRESEAADRKFTVMPMHKSNYVVVSDPETVKMIGKKVV